MDRLETSRDLTTGELIAWLHRLGFAVTETQIANDTRDHFLPKRPTNTIKGGGRSGLWSPWIARRAERLYRLRARRDGSGEPLVSGNVLRLLLFLRDGWGWDNGIKEICVISFGKNLSASLAPIKRYIKMKTIKNTEDIEHFISQHIEDYSPGPVERAAIGTLLFGTPLKDGSTERVMEAASLNGFFPAFDDLVPYMQGVFSLAGINLSENEARLRAGEILSSFFAASHDGREMNMHEMQRIVEEADAKLADNARKSLLPFLVNVRSFIRREARKEKNKSQKTNIITICGRTQPEIEKFLREQKAPQRMTAAQLLALFIATSLIGEYMLNQILGTMKKMQPLAWWLFTNVDTFLNASSEGNLADGVLPDATV